MTRVPSARPSADHRLGAVDERIAAANAGRPRRGCCSPGSVVPTTRRRSTRQCEQSGARRRRAIWQQCRSLSRETSRPRRDGRETRCQGLPSCHNFRRAGDRAAPWGARLASAVRRLSPACPPDDLIDRLEVRQLRQPGPGNARPLIVLRHDVASAPLGRSRQHGLPLLLTCPTGALPTYLTCPMGA